jgi:hypothetical protein
MTDRLLLASRRSEDLIGRTDELETARRAIYSAKSSLEVVFLYGDGGLGKSRLVEEILWRAGNSTSREQPKGEPPAGLDWTKSGKAIVADLIDMANSDYHSRVEFMHTVRDSLISTRGTLNFHTFDRAFRDFQRVRDRDVKTLEEVTGKVENSFLEAYNTISKKERIILTLDTSERLAYAHSTELARSGVIEPKRLSFNITMWLARQIETASLRNTTLFLVGRKTEGSPFYDTISQAVESAQKSGSNCHLTKLELQPFDLAETRQYFTALADSWGKNSAEEPQWKKAAQTFRRIADDAERLKTLWLYTGGQPVRLSLYGDLMLEGVSIPERLLDTPAQAEALLGQTENLTGKELFARREAVQVEIEKSFIHLLFSRPGLRAEILKALVRAPRGLNLEQLLVVLYPGTLKEQEKVSYSAAIAEELFTLRRLSIIKNRPGGRLGMQDEIYKVYARIMASDETNLADEKAARRAMYTRLYDLAKFNRANLEQEHLQNQEEDERRLVETITDPSNIQAIAFPSIALEHQDRRIENQEELRGWELEELHYGLLRNPTEYINNQAYDLGFRFFKSNDVERDFLNLDEIYQVINDESLMRFVHIVPWKGLTRSGKNVVDVLRFLMRQMEVVRWLQRFTLWKDYKRAVDFYAQVETWIKSLAPEEQITWNHPFSASERLLWRDYSRLLSGDILNTLPEMEDWAGRLEKLVEADDETQVEVSPGTWVYGFSGHPALDRLKKVISLYYNWIGYGYVSLGLERKAVANYARSLKYSRSTEFRDQMSVTLNNLARALSDMGRGRARRICLDGLSLNKRQGTDLYSGYSYNTLALIDNDRTRPDLAWEEAAIALAYMRRAEDSRAIGLAYLQLGEALRRLAGTERSGRVLPVRADDIYKESQNILEEALDIFSSAPYDQEVIRRIEALIELGCLLRDRVHTMNNEKERRQVANEARSHLTQASELAKKIHNPRLRLDADVNHAWLLFFNRDQNEAEEMLKGAEKQVPARAVIKPRHLPKAGPEKYGAYIYQQMSKIYGLRGLMALENFRTRANEVESKIQHLPREVRQKESAKDATARAFLERAATQYTLALAYAELFSPRASALTVLYDAIYERLKTFNPAEYELFKNFERAAREKYKTENIKPEGLANLDEFLRECFGIY